MKQIIAAIITVATAFGAGAESFTVSDGTGKTYADGEVINVGYTYDGFAYDWNPDLSVTVNEETSLLGGSNFEVTVEASEPNVVQFCGLSNSCTYIGAAPATHTGSCSKGQTFPLLVEILQSETILTSDVTAKVTITDGSQTTVLTINFLTTEAAGIHAAEAAAASTLTFSGRTMHFSVDSATKFSLYNISGRTVVDRTLAGSGSLNLSNIPAGVYVYRLGNKTGKALLH